MILTVEEARTSIPTSLSDDDLRRLLDAAEETIDKVCGRLSQNENQPVTSVHKPSTYGEMLLLAQRATEIVAVYEGSTLLSADDYELRPSGTILHRNGDGTNPRSYWSSPVTVTFTPYPDVNTRAVAQLELVRLDIAFNPGLNSQSIGPWSESYNAGKPYPQQRDEILESINPPFVGIW